VSVPQGCRVSVPARTAYRLSSKFVDATSYLPQRWLPDALPRYSADEKEIFEPSMVGPRNCLGTALACTQMKLILLKVFLTFNLQLSEELNVEDWGDQKDFFVPEAKPLSVTLSLRM
jgi:cytochrome P450